MNKYAEQMEKVAVNRLAAYLAEHPQHVSVLEPLIGHTAGNAAEVVRGARKLKVSPEARRAAQRAMEDAKPALRSPAQYATGLWGHAERRIPEELGRLGFGPGQVVTEAHGPFPSSHPAVVQGAVADAVGTFAEAAGGRRWSLGDALRRRKASSKLKGVLDAMHGRAFVHRYSPDTHLLSGEAMGGSMVSAAHPDVDLMGIKIGKSPFKEHGIENPHAVLLSIPENPGTLAKDEHNRALAHMQQAHVAHHELDEVHASARLGASSANTGFFSHASPVILANESRRMRGNPYMHLTTDVGNVADTRHATGEAAALHSLLGRHARGKRYGTVPISGKQVERMYGMHDEEMTSHANRFADSSFRSDPGGTLQDAYDKSEIRYGRFMQ